MGSSFCLSERDNKSNNFMADDDDANENERIARATQTVLALSALLGDSSSLLSLKDTDHADSVATWSKQNQTTTSSLQEVSKPSVVCPPYADPSSILIADSRTLEYELEDEPQQQQVEFKKPTICAVATSIATDNSSITSSTSSKVRFETHVRVVEIPSHRDMDTSMVNSIWTSVDDVQDNARRNAAEYHADGRDWTKVTEEDEMIWDDQTQELIHPATYEDLQLERVHQAHAAQQRQRRQQALQKLILENRLRSQDAEETKDVSATTPATSQSLQAQTRQMVAKTSTTSNKSGRPQRRISPKQQRRKQQRQAQQQQQFQRRAVASLTRFADT